MAIRFLIGYALIALLVAGAGLLYFRLTREHRSMRRMGRRRDRRRAVERTGQVQDRGD